MIDPTTCTTTDLPSVTQEDAEAAVAAYEQAHPDFVRTASAAKRGRNPKYPYVPVIKYAQQYNGAKTQQVLAVAFVTREEAVACAQAVIDRNRNALIRNLQIGRHRALREQFGLPRDVANV